MSNSASQLLTHLDAPVVALDRDGRITHWNRAAEAQLGWSRDEAVGKPARDLVIPPERLGEAARVHAALDSNGSWDGEFELMRKDGGRLVVYARDAVLRDDRAEVSGYVGVFLDASARREAESRTDEHRGLLQAMFDNALLPILLIDDERRCVDANDAALEMLGVSRDHYLTLGVEDLLPPDRREAARERWSGFLERGLLEGEYEILRSDGTIVETEFSARAHVIPGLHLAILRDVGERREAERRAKRRARQQAAIARLGKRALTESNLEELLDEAVEVALEAFGAELGDVVELCDDGRLVVRAGPGKGAELPAGRDSLTGYTLIREEPVVVEDWETEARFEPVPGVSERGARSGVCVVVPGRTRPFGALAIQATTRRRFDDEDLDALQALANVLADAIERARSEDRFAHQSLHDPLTGLPNRTLLHDRLAHALARAERDRRRVAVVFVDLDHFKLVNETLGHEAGDQLLAALGPRLTEAVRPSDTVARFAADQFALVCEDLESERDAIAIAERIAGACARPLAVAGQDRFVSVSMGIAMGPDPGAGPAELMRDADTALYRAKERGRGRYELYDEGMRVRYLERLGIESELRPALERGQLELVYQPVVSTEDGAVLGVEALLRWRHPERGLVAPDEFIPVAEETGLIVPIGRWVLEQACRQVSAWDTGGSHRGLTVSVNVSARQVAHGDLVAEVAQVLADTGIDPSRVALEITESVLMEEEEAALATLRGLKALGVRLFLDDFGTGFSSLGYLKRFPIDALKIDRSFVSELGQDVEDSIIVAAVMSMARALGLTVVAEGVETDQQLRHLRSLECVRAQGWFFAKPMPPDDLGALLAAARGKLRLLPPGGELALQAQR